MVPKAAYIANYTNTAELTTHLPSSGNRRDSPMIDSAGVGVHQARQHGARHELRAKALRGGTLEDYVL